MPKKFQWIIAWTVLAVGPLQSAELSVLRGRVTDSASGDALVAANVRALGTARGTITNTQGFYALTLPPGEYTMIYSYLGYQPETVAVVLQTERIHDVRLKPSPIQIPEVIILAEDPAIEIIRKAIAHKRSWMDRLQSYQFDAYTRQVFRRNDEIASVTEAYSTGYFQVGDTLREIVRQKRQTENIPISENFAAVRRIVNFNDDEIVLFSLQVDGRGSGYRFVGPTAPEALDHYDYKLVRSSSRDGVEIYEIRMTPKSRLAPLFDGTIIIADETFAVIGVDVKPNEAFTIPFVKDIDLRYRQQFALYDSIYWMPADIRLNGGFSVSFVGFSLPRIGIDVVSSIYDYEINVPIPDSIQRKARLTVDSSATMFDSTFWASNEILPLTTEEHEAYRTLDSAQTLERQFEPRGPIVTLGGGRTSSVLGMLDVRFNRVEGFYLGGRATIDSLSPLVRLQGLAGIGFSDKRFKYSLGATLFSSARRTLGLGAQVYRSIQHIPDGNYYGPLIISLMALIDKNDYRDYFLANGFRLFIEANPTRHVSGQVGFRSERHYSADLETNYSLFARNHPFRPNPLIDEGTLRSLRVDVRWGLPPVMFDLVARNALEVSVEHSSPRVAGSDFDFTRTDGRLTWSIPTFNRSLLLAPTLRIQVAGGIGTGSLPVQRWFILDSRASGYAPFGVLRGANVHEFQGDRFSMVNLEHNFRSLPFLALNLPFLYRHGIELLVHGSIAQTWDGTRTSSNGWFAETGIGLSRILDFFRADLTYRLLEPRRLYFTLSVATVF